jgi:hypothetical protein
MGNDREVFTDRGNETRERDAAGIVSISNEHDFLRFD